MAFVLQNFNFDDYSLVKLAKIKLDKALDEHIALAPLICENARIDVKDLRKKAIVRLISPRI